MLRGRVSRTLICVCVCAGCTHTQGGGGALTADGRPVLSCCHSRSPLATDRQPRVGHPGSWGQFFLFIILYTYMPSARLAHTDA
eukprot:6013614-Prymnesium_polylepis.1